MDTSPQRILQHPECLVVVFALDEPGALEALKQQRVAWPRYTTLEALDEDHFALIVHPGRAPEPAA
jgi:hypothetical protein